MSARRVRSSSARAAPARKRLAGLRARLRAERRDRSGADEIVCQLCGEPFRAITVFHLRRRHDAEGPTPVKDYKRRFGLRVAVSNELNEEQRRMRVAWFAERGRHWTKKRIVEELRSMAGRGRPLYSSRLPGPLFLAIRRLMGSWETAVRRAGFEPADHRLRPSLTEEDVVRWIRRLARSGPVTHKRVEAEQPQLATGATKRFGSWTRALVAAGLDPVKHRVPKHWRLETARAWVRRRHAAGRRLYSRDAPSGLLAWMYRATKGSWEEFLRASGIPSGEIWHRPTLSRQAVVAELRRRRRQGMRLNRIAVEAERPSLVHHARKYFGSFNAALRAAGIDPLQVVLLRPPWTRAEVIAGIRARHSAGRSMKHAAVYAEERRLLGAAKRHLRCTWAEALKTAGLDPALAGFTRRRRR